MGIRRLAAAAAAVLATTIGSTVALLPSSTGIGADDISVVLLAGRPEASLAVGDRSLLDWLRTQGRAITVVDDDAMSRDAIEAADLVVVSSSVTPSAVPSWLADIAVPILNLEVYAAPTLRLGSSPKEFSGVTTLDVVAHPVTKPLRGIVTVSSATTLGAVTPTAGGEVLARIPSRTAAALVLYDADEAGPARRANAFLGYPAPGALNSNGWRLVEQTMTWLLASGISPSTSTTSSIVDGTTTTTILDGTTTSTTSTSTTSTSTTSTSTTSTTTAPPPGVTLHVAPNGTGNCRSLTSPCGTIEAAVAIATGGERILVQAGTYRGPSGTQAYRRGTSRSAPVIVQPATPGAVVVLGGHHDIYTPRIVFDGIQLRRGSIKFRGGAHDGGVRNAAVTFGNISLLGADRVFVRDSVFRDNEEWDFIMIGLGSDDAVIAGNDMDDNPEIDLTDSDHADCIEIVGPDQRLVITDNVFTACGHAAMELVTTRGAIDDVLVSGNFFQECRVPTTQCYANVAVKVNDGKTVLKGPGGYPMTNVRLIGNVFDGGLLLKVTTRVVVTGNQMSAGRRSPALDVYDRCTAHTIEGNTIETYRGASCSGIPSANVIGPADCSPADACGRDPRE